MNHWEDVYGSRPATEVSWYEGEPTTSLRLLTNALPEKGSVIDVGAGTSTLVDHLLHQGWTDLTVLDISAVALEGARAKAVTVIEADLLTWTPDRTYDAWHDRAVFHFLTEPGQQRHYVKTAGNAVRPGGVAIIGTFAADGPTECSGLPTARYDAAELSSLFAPDFALTHSERQEHVTPWGAVQAYTWVVLTRTTERSP